MQSIRQQIDDLNWHLALLKLLEHFHWSKPITKQEFASKAKISLWKAQTRLLRMRQYGYISSSTNWKQGTTGATYLRVIKKNDAENERAKIRRKIATLGLVQQTKVEEQETETQGVLPHARIINGEAVMAKYQKQGIEYNPRNRTSAKIYVSGATLSFGATL